MKFIIAVIAAIGAAMMVALSAIDHLYPVAEAILESLTPFIGASNFSVVAAELFMPMFPILAPLLTFVFVFFGVSILLRNGGSV